MIKIQLLGPKHSQYALLSDETGAWVATTWGSYSDAVKAAIEAAIAKDSHQNDAAQGRD